MLVTCCVRCFSACATHNIRKVLRYSTLKDSSRRARLSREDAAELPASRCLSQKGIASPQFRQRHDDVAHENLGTIDLRIASIQARIEAAGESLVIDGTIRFIQRHVADGVRPGIGQVYQYATEPTLEDGLQSMVVGVAKMGPPGKEVIVAIRSISVQLHSRCCVPQIRAGL